MTTEQGAFWSKVSETRGGLERVIAAHLAEWDDAHVERAIYGSDDPAVIAGTIETFCRAELGASVARPLFYRSSVGAVAGLELHDGRRVVVKGHQPDWARTRLAEIVRLQRHLAARGLLAPEVLAGPSVLGSGLAVVESYVDRGGLPDAHEPEVRRALATALHSVIEALQPFTGASMLPSQLMTAQSLGALWPAPHSRLFDFDATRAGAEDIDRLASAARARMTPAGAIVLGHGDWRVEHVRFEGAHPVAAFDWDSLCRDREPASTARCGHALGADERRQPGTFQHLVATHGDDLLAL